MVWAITRRVEMRSFLAFAFVFDFLLRKFLDLIAQPVTTHFLFPSFYQLFDKESLAANLDDFLFTANDAVGTSGQFLELKRLSDALASLQQQQQQQQQQHLTDKDKTSSKDARRVHAMASKTESMNTAVTSSQGSDGGGRRGRLKNSNDGCYEEKGDEGDLGNRGSGGGGGGGGEEEMGVEGEGEGVEGEGEEGENPRLSEARREYPGFNLTGPDIYTSADDHCLQVSSCFNLFYLFSSLSFISFLFFFYFILCCYIL
jgi:hypothetical protein